MLSRKDREHFSYAGCLAKELDSEIVQLIEELIAGPSWASGLDGAKLNRCRHALSLWTCIEISLIARKSGPLHRALSSLREPLSTCLFLNATSASPPRPLHASLSAANAPAIYIARPINQRAQRRQSHDSDICSRPLGCQPL